MPVICVAFANGPVVDDKSQKIHKICKILDAEDNTVFSDALELHYIDMEAFVKTINESGGIGRGETHDSTLAKWLAVITEKDIGDKTLIKNICDEQEEIGMAVSELVKLSEDMIVRHAYQRRQDDIMLANAKAKKYEEMKRQVEDSQRRAEEAQSEAEDAKAVIADQSKQLADQAKLIAELQSKLGFK